MLQQAPKIKGYYKSTVDVKYDDKTMATVKAYQKAMDLSHCNLLTTIAWRLNGVPAFAFEGSVFIGGATFQWLRDEMYMIPSSAEGSLWPPPFPIPGVYLIPAFTGLGAPYWNM